MSSERLYTSRREFLTGSLTLLSAAGTLPIFLGETASALAGPEPQARRKSDSERILVVVQLAGGNDGLNTVIPYEQDPYYRFRRQIAIPADKVLRLEKGVGLHPAATGLKELFDDGQMAVIQGVGYPNPNRSHFTSMDIWHTADPDMRSHEGWIGRYFDSCCRGDDPAPEPITGIGLMEESPLALQGEKFSPLSFRDADALTWRAGKSDARAAETFSRLNNADGDLPTEGGALAQYLQRAALKARVGAEEIRSAGTKELGGGRRRGRGNELGRSLQLVAQLIAADLPTRIYYVSMGGFDTHTGQAGRHQQLMDQLGDAMAGFLDTLKASKLDERVLVMTFSEFGRRVQENASGGTDHGEAAPMFLFGRSVRPGVHEKHPDLTRLHRGDLAFGCDFRRVYATVLQHWLNARQEQVLGRRFPMLNVIRTG